jgi:hypothetical protein
MIEFKLLEPALDMEDYYLVKKPPEIAKIRNINLTLHYILLRTFTVNNTQHLKHK